MMLPQTEAAFYTCSNKPNTWHCYCEFH